MKQLITKFSLILSVFFGSNQAAVSQLYQSFELLITEVMFDPTPAVGMGAYEYVELYNASDDTINLAFWVWQVGSKSVEIPEFFLAPGAFVFLIPPSADHIHELDLIKLEKWLVLGNSGQNLVLKDPHNTIIHFMEYSPGMYKDALKRDGGWSLELVDINRPCASSSWMPANSSLGGTPGYLTAMEIEQTEPRSAIPIQSGYIDHQNGLIYFSEYLRPDIQGDDLQISSSEGQVLDWNFYKDRCDCIMFSLPSVYDGNGIIDLYISGAACSCDGLMISPEKLKWSVPKQAGEGDILISEIMFNPSAEGVEFIELFNDSGKVIDVNDLSIASTDVDGLVKAFSRSGEGSVLIFPGEYMVICTDKKWLLRTCPAIPYGNIYERKGLPAFANTGGGVRIMNSENALLDEIQYDPDWHNSRLETDKGVSLERISFTTSGMYSNNWYSSASINGFATPGQENSQMRSKYPDNYESIFLENPVFSPNNDGHKDVSIIHFKMNKLGYSGKLEVRNPAGMLIKEVHNWNLLPVEGQFIWDGMGDLNNPVDSGLYIILFNYRHPDGSGGRWKKAVAVRNY